MSDVEQLIELLRKVEKTKVPVHIDIDYNGRVFKWQVPIRNITANEYLPHAPREHECIDSRH